MLVPKRALTSLAFAILFLAATVAHAGGCPKQAQIGSPQGGTYSPTADIGVSGTADANSSFTVQIINPGNKTVYGSEGVTANMEGSWSTTLDAPSNGWPKNTTLQIQAVCGGTILSYTEIFITE